MPILDPQHFREIVSGRRRGATASMWRCVLGAAEIPYTWEVQRRNRQYDTGKRPAHRAGVPVVSVGNITLGGTGKTPMVAWLARWFRERNVRVAIISRGYGADEGARNDEALELEEQLPDVPHVQNPDRVEAAKMAVEEFETQLIVMDDAFQHRRIHRDLDIVLLDALEPFGFEHVFPRGTLREPLAGLKRANVVALTRADMIEPHERAAIRRRVDQFHPDVPWMELTHAPTGLVSASGQEQPADSLAGRRVAAFCGIGNPAGFRHTLTQCGYSAVSFQHYPDHHGYTRHDIQSLTEWAAKFKRTENIAAAVCTQKDLVKIGLTHLGDVPLFALRVSMQILSGRELLEARLLPLLNRMSP